MPCRNTSSKGQVTQFAGCLMRGQSKEELVENVHEVSLLSESQSSHIQSETYFARLRASQHTILKSSKAVTL